MKSYTEIIAKYIAGELPASDKTVFEKELANNPELKKEYELQLSIIEGTKRLGLKKQLGSSLKTVKRQKLIKKIVTGVAIAITATGAFLLIKQLLDKPKNNILYELNEQGNKNWSEADKVLDAQVFTLNPLRDTIIETQKGIVISIPAGSFLNKFGEIPEGRIDLEVKEAMTPLDIMKAGLNTMSNGELLETGGMFYINARDGEENLTINQSKPLNANVPVNNNKKDMMLFKGERKADGSINWIDPKPMRKRLTTVDITSLDFYPEHFLDSLKEMGFDVKNKKLTDSIYYSFSGYCHFNIPAAPPVYDSEGGEYSFDEISEMHGSGRSHPAQSPGEKLFKQNCAMCHTMTDQKLTGPGLAGVAGRVPGGDWLQRYILNNYKMMNEGDPYAVKVFNENGGGGMPAYDGALNSDELNTLIKYLTGKEAWNMDEDLSESCVEINPARIKAIWDKQFNHTILATKEFEERLKIIFKTCDAGILNLYIKNLNQDLCQIDSLAAARLGGELKTKFLEFYSRKDGCVDISDEQNQKLQNYFDEKRIAYAKAINKTLDKMYREEAKKSQVASEEYIKHMNNEILRNSKVFTEELDLNMKEAYRQLGGSSAPPPTNYLSTPISQTGWNNVDKYVIESTINRSTLDYTDPKTGKKAVIKYEPITIIVTNFADYDKVMSYMIPDKLSSFQLLKKEGTAFKENLNELIKYAVVTVGFKGNSTYYHVIEHAKAQTYNVELASIKQNDLNRKLNTSFGFSADTDFAREINYQLFETKEAVRKEQVRKREEIQSRLKPVVFPCALPAAPSDSVKYDEM
jgi:cytochrome c2